MSAIALQSVVDAGTKPASQNSTASDTVNYGNGHNTFLVYTNTGGSPAVVTVTPTQLLTDGVAYPAKSWTVAATTGVVWIPVRREYDDGTGANTAVFTATNSGATLQVSAVVVNW